MRGKTQQELAAVGPKQKQTLAKTESCQNLTVQICGYLKNSFRCQFRAVQDIDLKLAGVTPEDKSYLVFKF